MFQAPLQPWDSAHAAAGYPIIIEPRNAALFAVSLCVIAIIGVIYLKVTGKWDAPPEHRE